MKKTSEEKKELKMRKLKDKIRKALFKGDLSYRDLYSCIEYNELLSKEMKKAERIVESLKRS